MMDARDELIEQIARAMWAVHESDPASWKSTAFLYQQEAEAALSVIETATSTCPTCEGRGYYLDSMGACASCGGQPGPLLVLQVLGGEQTSLPGTERMWRFPRGQAANDRLASQVTDLTKYAQHLDECSINWLGKNCTCGRDALLARLSPTEEPPELTFPPVR